jgi:N-acyl-D-amino-acid deacylase
MAFDLILRNARLVDGTGTASQPGDLAIAGERIAALGQIKERASNEIDVDGQAVAPGFIDVHTHDDRALLANPGMAMKASQGVTSVVVGNCGISLAPLSLDGVPPPPLDLLGERPDFRFVRFADYLAALDAAPAAVNAACMVGHSTLRVGCMGDVERPATAAEIDAMRMRLCEGLDAGAIGFSTGLAYAPSAAAPAAEVEVLAREAGRAGAIYTTHMRNEGDAVMASLEESFATAKSADVPVVISHHKVSGIRNAGRSVETLPRISRAIGEQEAGLDAYPYVASSTVLTAEMAAEARRVLVSWSRVHPEMAGRDLAAIASDWGIDRAAAARRLQPAGAVYWSMDEADVRRILAFEHTMIGSDGLPHDSHPHPRLWGSFPRVLGHYSREVGLFSLEEAVRKMTSLPARRFGLKNRGRLAPGAFADITVFDPERVLDRATFDQPDTPAAGISLVLVNGKAVWRDDKSTGARPGRVLRRKAA